MKDGKLKDKKVISGPREDAESTDSQRVGNFVEVLGCRPKVIRENPVETFGRVQKVCDLDFEVCNHGVTRERTSK